MPTDGTCKAVVAWKIEEGHHGDVRLDGLCVANLYSWPGPIHKGSGTMQSVIDERATADQRKALIAILQGEGAAPGTIMLQIYRAMCATLKEPLSKPVNLEIDVDGRKAKLSIPGLVETTVEPIVNAVTGAVHRARIDLPMGKEFNIAEVASGTTKAGGDVPFDFAKSHAHLVHNVTSSSGIAAQ